MNDSIQVALNAFGTILQNEPHGTWKVKHTFVRLFYHVRRPDKLKIWEKISAGRELRPSVWTEFVESQELWGFCYDILATMSHITINNCAQTELVDDGMDAVTEDSETYFLVPLMHALFPPVADKADPEKTKYNYACQQFMKSVLIYAFADIYKKKFKVFFTSHDSFDVDQNTLLEPLPLSPKGSA